jgi:hypothetical protein
MMSGLVARFRFAVIPARAGIHVDLSFVAQMDPGFRRDDDEVLT